MNFDTLEGQIKNDIHLAKQALIKARIARQIGTVTREMSMFSTNEPDAHAKAQALLDEAKELRLEAQELLREVERSNGCLHLAGLSVFPLKKYLAGKFYKTWNNFDAEYAEIGAPFFGSDPE